MKISILLLLIILHGSLFAQTRIRVLTYNIYHGEQAYRKGQPNLDSVAALINRLQPDFVACQEVDSATGRSAGVFGRRVNLMQELAGKTGMTGYFGKAMDYDGGGYGEGLLSRHPGKTTLVPLPSPSGGEPRALLYLQAVLPGGKQVLFGGTHLCHQFSNNRLAQVGQINKALGNAGLPAIVCGDFNATPSDTAYGQMRQQWLDAATAGGQPQNTFSFDRPKSRIDYAFLSKNARWKVKKATVLPVGYSDHMPVLFELELE
jgi:endonuclease/exonuclease/phosphatase family metal-dependent hydrolase